MTKRKSNLLVYRDFNSRTCIQVNRGDNTVEFVSLDVEDGLYVQSTSVESFEQRYHLLEKYPIDQAIKLFVSYGLTIGMSKEALDYFGQIQSISKEDCEMAISNIPTAKSKSSKPKTDDELVKTKKTRSLFSESTSKKTVAKKAPDKKVVAKKAPDKKVVAKKAPDKKVVAKKALAATKKAVVKKVITNAKKAVTKKVSGGKPYRVRTVSKSGKYKSASQMFQGLIMDGKLTDAKIFEAVQKEFEVGEDKRYYVQWYRGHLQRRGESPPASR